MKESRLLAVCILSIITAACLIASFTHRPKFVFEKFCGEIIYDASIPDNYVALAAIPGNISDIKFETIERFTSRIVFYDETPVIIVGFPFIYEETFFLKTEIGMNTTYLLKIKVDYEAGKKGIIVLNRFNADIVLILIEEHENELHVRSLGSIRNASKCIDIFGYILSRNRTVPHQTIQLHMLRNDTNNPINITQIKIPPDNETAINIYRSSSNGFYRIRLYVPEYPKEAIFLIFVDDNPCGFLILPNTPTKRRVDLIIGG
ncbi:MAG: hypothetical protein DRJ32_00250 [Thermoprotei archaeon]|nr:MAG: hypothetical protein B6U94_01090 [Thermofilum sp. ex4484_79]RLE61745.1 MAG: hypothetical protein DRJ32_00250 [Thermoprotei archaeon]HDD63565.1 hypothetical protein [Thermoprotei archaeon]